MLATIRHRRAARWTLPQHALVGVAPGGRVFRNAAGNYIDAAAYGTTWHRAREAALTLDELALELAQRPYDLRRAGQSIQVLFRCYAKFLTEARHHANRLIEDSMRRWDERGGRCCCALVRA